jgi:hypothetical protein
LKSVVSGNEGDAPVDSSANQLAVPDDFNEPLPDAEIAAWVGHAL